MTDSTFARRRSSIWTRLFVGVLFACSLARASAQIVPGANVNMVAGQTWPDGDPFLQRQNEPSIAVSSRNVLHLVAGANDYRTVDLPGLPADKPTGDAWLGLFKSLDGGRTWKSTLLPGYPQDNSAIGVLSPLKGFDAAADPLVRSGANGLFVYSGIAFQRCHRRVHRRTGQRGRHAGKAWKEQRAREGTGERTRERTGTGSRRDARPQAGPRAPARWETRQQ